MSAMVRSRDTEVALRRAALRLVGERGYAATTVDDIAAAAALTTDTFFLYFPNKESAVLFPDGLVAGLVLAGLSQRPRDEAPTVALVAAVATTFDSLYRLTHEDDLHRIGLRVMLHEPELRGALLERRLGVEAEAWTAMQRRGVAPDDLAVRAATATVVTLGFLALQRWAEGDGSTSLTAILADCLRAAPAIPVLDQGLDAAGLGL